jgi:hypothetical protein
MEKHAAKIVLPPKNATLKRRLNGKEKGLNK